MIDQQFDLRDFIQVDSVATRELGWPRPSPFNLKFSSRKLTDMQLEAISGSGLYMISKGDEVVYVGLYKPQRGNIIADRWGRHLQTITGRGYNIGLGGKNPTARRDALLAAVAAPRLREAIEHAYLYSQASRYKDTGYNTTPNRLRFASENWDNFGQDDSEQVLRPLTFWLLRTRVADSQETAARDVKAIETRVLQDFKPACNKEYKHDLHEGRRKDNTVEALTEAIRQAAHAVTNADVRDRIQLSLCS